jgi:hypothetical protein
MNRKNMFLAGLLLTAIVFLLTGNKYICSFQAWLESAHSISGLVIILGAIVIIIGTKVLWK